MSPMEFMGFDFVKAPIFIRFNEVTANLPGLNIQWHVPVQFPLSSSCVLLTHKQSYEPLVFIQMADGGQL